MEKLTISRSILYSFLILNIYNICRATDDDIYETKHPIEAQSIFLKGEQIIYTEDALCTPLNNNGQVMYDFINGDKVCYLALKHPYSTRRHRNQMNGDHYKKSECLKQPVLILMKKFGPTIQKTEATSCNFINKNGEEDIFYIANTRRVEHYAILEQVNNIASDDMLLKLSVVAILKLKFQKLKHTNEMQMYFRTPFSTVFWETTNPKLALKMFKVGGRVNENGDEHVSSRFKYGVKTIARYSNADKICFVAFNHPHMIEMNRHRLDHHSKSMCSPYEVLMSDDIAGSVEKVLVCNCLFSGGSFYIGSTSKNGHYVILEDLGRGINKLKVVAILYLQCTRRDFIDMQNYFGISDNRAKGITENVLKKSRYA